MLFDQFRENAVLTVEPQKHNPWPLRLVYAMALIVVVLDLFYWGTA
jgi:hypothetical protein